MSLSGIEKIEWRISRLEIDTEIKNFESSDTDLNNFLLEDAKNYLTQMW